MEKPEDKPFPTEETVDPNPPEVIDAHIYIPNEGEENHICELAGSTVVMVREDKNKIYNATISEMYQNRDKIEYEIYCGEDKWTKCKVNLVGYGTLIELKTSFQHIVKVGPNHLQKVFRQGEPKVVEARDIELFDVLYFDHLYTPASEVFKSARPGGLYSVELEGDDITFMLGNSFMVHNFTRDDL